jgi:cell division septation protein DedD
VKNESLKIRDEPFFLNFAGMIVEKHISILLFRHDCVIIPGFGGFVTNYSPAQIHPTQHTFSPPCKSIVFNKSLKNNDGLLANHIAQEEQLSYAEALQQVSAFAAACLAAMGTGDKLQLKDIGALYYDIERNIQFQPDANTNYLIDSFGLTTFQSPAIKRETFVKRMEKAPQDRDVIPAAARSRFRIKHYVALSLSAAAIFAMIWIPLRTDLLKGINYSNLNPFAKKEKSLYTEKKGFSAPVPTKDISIPSLPDLNTDTSKYVSLSFVKKDATPITVRMNEVSVPESTAVSNMAAEKINSDAIKSSAGDKYSVIGGCFAIPENADHFVAQLRAEGHDAFILETNRSVLRHVSYGSYSSYAQATAELAKVRASNKEVWLLIK